jgi:restriction endonuclease Mrr
MAVPSFDSLMLPVLSVLEDGTVGRPKEVCEKVATELGISTDDQDELLPSGAMSRYRNRILWALHYLKRAGVVTSPGRGLYGRRSNTPSRSRNASSSSTEPSSRGSWFCTVWGSVSRRS